MAKLQWEKGKKPGVLCRAKSKPARKGRWWRVVATYRFNRLQFGILRSDNNLYHESWLEPYLDTLDEAKAACQAAEDKLCDVWPKFTETYARLVGTVFDRWISPTEYYNVVKSGLEYHISGKYDRCERTIISKDEAMSRLDKPISDYDRGCRQTVKDIWDYVKSIEGWSK